MVHQDFGDKAGGSQQRPIFEMTFNFGHVMTLAGFLLAASVAYIGVRTQVEIVGERLTKLEQSINQSRLDEKLNAISLRLDAIERELKK